LKPSRNSRIDLLRGISILLVVLDHLTMRFAPKNGVLGAVLPERVIDGLFTHGYEAVFIFFVISGFLIASNALTSWYSLDRIDLRAFYARRFARIVPSLLALVAVLCVLDLLRVDNYVIDQPGQSLAGASSSALGLYLNWYEGHTRHYLPGSWDVLWSLSIEEVFYLAFPVLCLLLKRQWLLIPCVLALAASLPWTRAHALAGGELWQQKAYLPGMAAIAAGVLTAIVSARVRFSSRRWTHSLIFAGWLGIAAALFADDVVWRLLHDAGLLLLTVSASVLLLGFHRRESDAANAALPLPGTAWISSFGRLSYEVYLTHMFVVFAAVKLYRAAGGNPKLAILWLPPSIAVVWLLGKLIELVVSTPCNRALRRLLIKRSVRAAQPQDC
jgi:peptidoglycan/LPS O-acetylase OafA/YrhL